jgi:hypothetical protein
MKQSADGINSVLRRGQLQPLRKRLARLRRRRQRFRWSTAASALAIAALWALAGVFALDWCFQRNVDLWQRLLLLGMAGAAVTWAFARLALPWLGKREDDTDMAILVQRHSGIDSDLVAALQFEASGAAGWGSTQLESAVIDRVAARQRDLDVMAAMPRQPLVRRLKVLIATMVAWALLGWLAPGHVRVFFQRMAFGSQHYPAATQLVAITVNGRHVDPLSPGEAAVHVPCGEAVRFEVTVAGSQPAAGRVELFTQSRGPAANVPLEPSPGGDGDPAHAQYRGEYAALNQSAHYQVYVGDAWTDALALSVTPLPAIEIAAEVAPPIYARQSAHDVQKLPRGMRQFAVLAGSDVRLALDSDRPLSAAEVTVAGQKYAMQRTDRTHHAPRDAIAPDAPANGKEVWTLPAAGTPLAGVAKELPFSIQIHDAEGQTLDRPLEGSILIEADLPPGITASTKTPIVLPTGSPTIHYEAADDHALGCIWLTWEATAVGQAFQPDNLAGDNPAGGSPPGGNPAGDTAASPTSTKRAGHIEICRFPPEASPRSREGDYRLALRSLPLQPGDTLKVTFHASDYRGPATAATADADPPLVFQVTDLQGFEASMVEADQKSAGVLEDLRKKHSGLGETQ